MGNGRYYTYRTDKKAQEHFKIRIQLKYCFVLLTNIFSKF